jgi:hypothetical protein
MIKVLNKKSGGVHLWNRAANKRLHIVSGLSEVDESLVQFFHKEIAKDPDLVINPQDEVKHEPALAENGESELALVDSTLALVNAEEIEATEEAPEEIVGETTEESKGRRGRPKKQDAGE